MPLLSRPNVHRLRSVGAALLAPKPLSNVVAGSVIEGPRPTMTTVRWELLGFGYVRATVFDTYLPTEYDMRIAISERFQIQPDTFRILNGALQ
jgi:hypothetical protein